MDTNGKHAADGSFAAPRDRQVIAARAGAASHPPATSALLASSAGLGWSTISAELRSHGVGETSSSVLQDVEVCLVVAGNDDGLVCRTGAGTYQETIPQTGTIWLSPAGVGSSERSITAPVPQTLHLYLPAALFERLKDELGLSVDAPAHSIKYEMGIRDEVIEHIGLSILAELTGKTAASRMYVKAASLTLAARLLQRYFDDDACLLNESSISMLDQDRLQRVLDHIAGNVRDDITMDHLAGIAGYSPSHFARKFTLAMGVSPSRYISRLRLESAMAEIAGNRLPLAQIALNANFSSQASFTRAFHRAVGTTPKEYQRRQRQRERPEASQ